MKLQRASAGQTLGLNSVVTVAGRSQHAAAYLHQGFVPDAERAARSLEALLSMVSDHSGVDRSQCLAEIVETELRSLNGRDISVPITAGLDSRFLLGAVRKAAPDSRIVGYSWGERGSDDYLGGLAAAKSVAVEHKFLDVKKVSWPRDKIRDLLDIRGFGMSGLMPRVDGVWLLYQLEDEMARCSVKLSGVLLDWVTGSHSSLSSTAERFSRLNFSGIDTGFDAVGYYSDFLRTQERTVAAIMATTRLTALEVLDYGFRQQQRIMPAMFPGTPGWIAPGESRRWIAAWASLPIGERHGQRLYRSGLRDRYPTVFPTQQPLGQRLRRISRPLYDRRPSPMRDRADPRRNESFRELVSWATAKFDAQRYGVCDAGEALQRLMSRPSKADWNIVMLATSYQIYSETD